MRRTVGAPVMATLALLTALAARGVARPHAAAAYADGAPAGFSGGFGEASCDACHFHAAVNSGPGRAIIVGVPARFVAGERYPLTVTLERPGMVLGGFQLTARVKGNGAQAGTLAPAAGEEGRVRVEVREGVEYATQRQKGATLTAPGQGRWTLTWTAPESGESVVFNVAANAADGDGAVEGDYIHTAVAETAPSARHFNARLSIR